jgi:hypothetical protein
MGLRRVRMKSFSGGLPGSFFGAKPQGIEASALLDEWHGVAARVFPVLQLPLMSDCCLESKNRSTAERVPLCGRLTDLSCGHFMPHDSFGKAGL